MWITDCFVLFLIVSEPSGKFSSHEKLNNCIRGVIKGLCTLCTVYLAGAQYCTLNCTHTRVQVSEKLFAFLINNTGVTFPNLVLPVKYNLFANYRRGANKQPAIIF